MEFVGGVMRTGLVVAGIRNCLRMIYFVKLVKWRLMMEYKVGDIVKYVKDYYKNDSDYFSLGTSYTITEKKDNNVFISYYLDDIKLQVFNNQIKLEEPMFKEGDVIVTKEGEYKTKILAVCGGCFLESTIDNYAEVGDWCTFEHAKNKGWKLYEAPKDTVTLTTDDGTKIEISKQSLEGLKKL